MESKSLDKESSLDLSQTDNQDSSLSYSKGKKAAAKPTAASQEPTIAADQRYKGIEEKTIPKSAVASQESAVVADPLYKGIKGIVLYDGKVIEGQIISMNAEIVKIRTKDGNVWSYSFIKEVECFIHE
jgi:hypothetical protein